MADAPEGFVPFYFPLEKNGKDPRKGISWKTNRKTFSEAYNLLRNGFNIGIAATEQDKLVIVDIDDLGQVKDQKPTLTVISRKRVGQHCFYFTEEEAAKTIFDNSAKQNIATEEAGEVRAVWQYVVAAGSYVPCDSDELQRIPETDKGNAGRYSVMVDRSVTQITYEELPEAFKFCLQNKRAVDIANHHKQEKRPRGTDKESKNKSALWDLTIYDITGKPDDPSFRFTSPFHGSKTNANASVSNGMLHCWRHNCSHTALTYLASEAGVSTCSSAGYGHNGTGGSDVNFNDPATVYKIWTYAKQRGYIQDSDPMPTRAMVYYAMQEKMCSEKEVIDGWKLPRDVYNDIIEKAPFNVGREPIKARAERIGNALQASMESPLQIAISLQEQVPIYYDPSKNYWMWNDELKKYDRVDETEILVQISSSLDLTIYKSNIKNEILEAIRHTGRQRRLKTPKKEWIQFENKVVNIETLETFEATPDYFFTSPIPHKLGSTEDTPLIDALFSSWMGDKTDLLYEICAYCMYDDYPIQRIFVFIGPGSNGKGQYMTLLRRMLGTENCIGTDLDRLAKNNFESAKLYNKKAAFVGETNYTLSRTSMLKALSGGDFVSCEFKGKDPFDFVNTAKIIIATNGLPATTDQTVGFYRRWCLLEFKNSFPDGKNIVDTIPDEEYENLCLKCVKLLKEILTAGKLPHEEPFEIRRAKYESLSNPIQTFVETYCEPKESERVPAWFLYEKYDLYREKRGHRKVSKREFGITLHEMGHESYSNWYTKTEVLTYTEIKDLDDGKNWKTYRGLSYNPNKTHSSDGSDVSIIPNFTNETNRELSQKSHIGKLTESTVSLVSPVSTENIDTQPNENSGKVRYEGVLYEPSDSSVSTVSLLQILDALILDEVKNVYHGMVTDEYEFEQTFCDKTPWFKGSLVRERMTILKKRGWKH